MTDPRSIMEGPPRDAFEESLIDAARQDRMPESSRARVLQALGVPALAGAALAAEAVASAPAASAPMASAPVASSPSAALAVTAKSAAFGWGKVLGLAGLVLPAAGLGGWLLLSSADPVPVSGQDAVAQAPPARAPGTDNAETSQAPAEVATPAPNVVSWEELLGEETPAAEATRSGQKNAGSGTMAAEPQLARSAEGIAVPSLAEEVAAIRQARSTLSGGRAAAALEQLDAYAARFPRGRLRQEASVLKIEALLASGDRAAAERLARPMLEQNSAYAARIRALLER